MIYTITHGIAERLEDGTFIIRDLKLIPERPNTITIPEIWQQPSSTYGSFTDDLTRNGYLYQDSLNLSGRQLRGLHQYLVHYDYVPSVESWADVFRAWSSTFKLPFKNIRSLQERENTTDMMGSIQVWDEILTFARSHVETK